jgi:spermidine synthase
LEAVVNFGWQCLIFLSGFTGLIYQVTWQKYLSVLLGSHAAATSIILALFFLFLSLGYLFFGRLSHKIHHNQLRLYGIFELLIGLFALYSPLLFTVLFNWYSSQATQTAGQEYLLGLVVSGVFIFIPTFLMGGTLPVLVDGLSQTYEVSTRTHARIYSINTLGAFAGCLAAGFWLIERFGLADTLLIGSWVNLAIGVVVLVKLRNAGPSQSNTEANIIQKPIDRATLILGAISFLSGFYVFAFEKIIIRMSGLVFGSSTYTYSIIVSAFILALGIGSYLIGYFDKWLNQKIFLLNMVLSVIMMSLVYFLIPYWPEFALRIRFLFFPAVYNFIPYWLTVLMSTLLLLMVPIGLLGMNLPFLFSILKKQDRSLAQSVGNLYAVNCLGAAAGAVFGGYWLLKFFSSDVVYRISLTFLIISATLVVLCFTSGRKTKIAILSLLAILTGTTWAHSGWGDKSFTPGRYLFAGIQSQTTNESFQKVIAKIPSKKILFSVDDPNTYVTVTQETDKDIAVYLNGKPDAITSVDENTRAMAVLAPIALSPNPVKSIFIAGLGGGLSTGIAALFSEVEKIDVAEISQGVVDALPFFKPFNYGLEERPEKYSIQVGDAYKVLMSSEKKYDLIVCEPSSLWVAGIEKLFSIEFYELVANNLTENGLFAQWFPLYGADPETFRIILNTYSKKFRYVSVWASGAGSALTIIGSNHDFVPNINSIERRFNEHPEVYKKFGAMHPLAVLYNQILTPTQVGLLIQKVESINSVFAPILEYKAGRAFFAGLTSPLTPQLLQKALLPLPGSESMTLPFWKTQNLPFNSEAFLSSIVIKDQLFQLRLRLLNYSGLSTSIRTQDYVTDLMPYLFLIGAASQKELEAYYNSQKRLFQNQSDPLVVILASDLSARLRDLLAIGLRPRFSNLTGFIENSCVGEDCVRAKYASLAWTSGPVTWSSRLSGFDSKNFTAQQKSLIEAEYERVKTIYKSLEAF